MGITRDDGADQSPTTGSGFHLVLAGNIVFYQKWNAMQRPADRSLLALRVQSFSDVQCIGIELQDSTVFVRHDDRSENIGDLLQIRLHLVDTFIVALEQLDTSQVARLQLGLDFIDAGLLQFEAVT